MSAQWRLRNRTVFSSVFLVSLRLVPLPWRASNTLFRRMICSTVSSVGCLSRPLLTRSMRPPGTMSWLGRLSWKWTPVAQWNTHYAQFVGTLSEFQLKQSYTKKYFICTKCEKMFILLAHSFPFFYFNHSCMKQYFIYFTCTKCGKPYTSTLCFSKQLSTNLWQSI